MWIIVLGTKEWKIFYWKHRFVIRAENNSWQLLAATAITLYPHNSVQRLHSNISLDATSINAIPAYADN